MKKIILCLLLDGCLMLSALPVAARVEIGSIQVENALVIKADAPVIEMKKDTAANDVKNGFRQMSRGMGKIFKRELKRVGKAAKKIGKGGKTFVKKLGKGISDSFKSDSAEIKK